MTLREFFLSPGQDLAKGVAQGIETGGDTAAFGIGGAADVRMLKWPVFSSAVSRHIGELLDVGIPDVLANAWNKSAALREHFEKSRQSPGESFLLPLAEHTIESEHTPSIEVLKNGKPVAKLVFTARVALTVEGAVLRIQNGEIRDIQTGQVRGSGTLKCGGAVLVEKETQAIPLPGRVVLREDTSAAASASAT
jgi:hypothetical protein